VQARGRSEFGWTRFIHGPVPDRQHPNYNVSFGDLVNDAVHVRLLAIEQMTKRPFELPRFRSNRAPARGMLKSVNGLLKPVVPAGSSGGLYCVDTPVKIAEVARGASG